MSGRAGARDGKATTGRQPAAIVVRVVFHESFSISGVQALDAAASGNHEIRFCQQEGVW